MEANVEQEVRVDADLDTLATALYARTDDLLKSLRMTSPFGPTVMSLSRVIRSECRRGLGSGSSRGSRADIGRQMPAFAARSPRMRWNLG